MIALAVVHVQIIAPLVQSLRVLSTTRSMLMLALIAALVQQDALVGLLLKADLQFLERMKNPETPSGDSGFLSLSLS
jgi:hypothetical protein